MYLVGNNGNIHDINKIDPTPRPGKVDFVLQQTVYNNNQAFTFILAKFLWLLLVIKQLMEHFDKPVQVWRYQLHERFGPAAFSAQRIRSRYMHVACPNKDQRIKCYNCPASRQSLQYLKVTSTKK